MALFMGIWSADKAKFEASIAVAGCRGGVLQLSAEWLDQLELIVDYAFSMGLRAAEPAR